MEDAKNIALSNELKFNNTSLGEVLKDMCAFYNIKISYQDAEIEKMNFTGVINRTDNAGSILKVITQMNDLELLKIPDGFIVSRPLRK
jgi:ferric-dicitrate binding protein FerR (iron transport regulator)